MTQAGWEMTTSFPVSPGPRFTPPTWVDSTERAAKVSALAPRIPWDRFAGTGRFFDPTPGEHVGIIGPTGQGKTVLQNHILPLYPFVAVFATKRVDVSMNDLVENGGYIRLAAWHRLNPIDAPRRVIWPQAESLKQTVPRQREVFEEAINSIFMEGGRPAKNPVGWAIAIDELWYFTNMLKLDTEIKMILLQGRSAGISLIAATQRPAWVPLEIYDQSTHLFFFRDNDSRNLDRIAGIGVADRGAVKDLIANLDRHQVLYVNTRTGKMARTRAPAPARG